MAINLDAIKNRLATLQTTTGKRNMLWKPEPGKTDIRIVPYQFNKDNPFQELYFHYNVGKKTYLSPITFGEADPILEFAEQLKQSGNQDDWKLGRKLEPTMRTFVPIIVRGAESEGVKFWGFGKQIYQELLSIISDPDYGDISDLKNGRDITLEYLTPAQAGNDYGKTAIRVKPNQKPATEDRNVAKTIMEGQTDIFDVYAKSSYDELKSALEAWLNPENAEEVPGETEEKSEKTATATEEKSEKTTTSVDAATKDFDDIFNS